MPPDSGLTAHGIATFALVVIQGAFVISKAADDAQVVLDAIEHVRRYVRCLFTHDKEQRHD